VADVHPIRLRGPWQFQVLWQSEVRTPNPTRQKQQADFATEGTVQMPIDWEQHLGSDFRGCVRYARNFGCPTALEPHEAVFLVLAGLDAIGRVELNGERLGEMTFATGAARFEITHRLNERNELAVEVELPNYPSSAEEQRQRGGRCGQSGGLFGEVRLEICSGT
jgi:hypothetical protein